MNNFCLLCILLPYLILNMSISENIKIIRKSKKMTQQEVADILKINRLAFTRLETMGNDLTFTQIINIANALEVSVNQLLEGVSNTFENKEYDILKNENKKLNSKIEDLEDDKKNLKEIIAMLDREVGSNVIIASKILMPFIFEEFKKIVKKVRFEKNTVDNPFHSIFEILVSIDKEINNAKYMLPDWDIEESFISNLMSYEDILIKRLSNGNEPDEKDTILLFQKEYFKFMKQCNKEKEERWRRRTKQSRTQ